MLQVGPNGSLRKCQRKLTIHSFFTVVPRNYRQRKRQMCDEMCRLHKHHAYGFQPQSEGQIIWHSKISAELDTSVTHVYDSSIVEEITGKKKKSLIS